MTDIYAYPNANQTQNIGQLLIYINDVTGGIFFPLILLAMFIISFVTTTIFGVGNAFVYASFFTSILSIFMAIAGLLKPTWMYFAFVLLAISLMLKRISKSSTLPQI